jgi:hypothetical protein
MPQRSNDPEYMGEVCQQLCRQAAQLSKGKRFEFFASHLPDPILMAVIESAEALRHGDFEREFSGMLFSVGLEVRYLLYGRTAMHEIYERDKCTEWALSVSLALILESWRRRKPSLGVRLPTDPFSKWQMRVCLAPVAEYLGDVLG